jgi:trehalose synthase
VHRRGFVLFGAQPMDSDATLGLHSVEQYEPLIGAAAVERIMQKADSLRAANVAHGFGLTVSEAMWKGAAVVGGNVGGIRRQIKDGENGFLVDTVDQAAQRIVQLLTDQELRERLGANAKRTVRENFLLTRLMEDWIDLLADKELRSS